MPIPFTKFACHTFVVELQLIDYAGNLVEWKGELDFNPVAWEAGDKPINVFEASNYKTVQNSTVNHRFAWHTTVSQFATGVLMGNHVSGTDKSLVYVCAISDTAIGAATRSGNDTGTTGYKWTWGNVTNGTKFSYGAVTFYYGYQKPQYDRNTYTHYIDGARCYMSGALFTETSRRYVFCSSVLTGTPQVNLSVGHEEEIPNDLWLGASAATTDVQARNLFVRSVLGVESDGTYTGKELREKTVPVGQIYM